MRSVLQDWVMRLGLRHQGVLINSLRGCDTAPKNDPSKLLTRCYRAEILNCHCGDPSKAQTYIESVPETELTGRMLAVRKNLDHYPHHYVMHLIHSVQVLGYKSENRLSRILWGLFYDQLCDGLHVRSENEYSMDKRLNMDEESFGRKDRS